MPLLINPFRIKSGVVIERALLPVFRVMVAATVKSPKPLLLLSVRMVVVPPVVRLWFNVTPLFPFTLSAPENVEAAVEKKTVRPVLVAFSVVVPEMLG